MAYKALSAEADSTVKKMRIELGQLYLCQLVLNNDAKKEDLKETLARALPRMAKHLLIETGDLVIKYGEHNLVADLLMSHHQALLQSNDGSLMEFIAVYKKVNLCGRALKSGQELFNRCFPDKTASKTDGPEGSKDGSDAIVAMNRVHPPGTADKSSQASPLVC
jgi:hypothetical protein